MGLIVVEIPARDLSLFQNAQTGFGAHLPSYPIGTDGHFYGSRAV
jgi:hypothetical protein